MRTMSRKEFEGQFKDKMLKFEYQLSLKEGYAVIHKNGNTLDNRDENLERINIVEE